MKTLIKNGHILMKKQLFNKICYWNVYFYASVGPGKATTEFPRTLRALFSKTAASQHVACFSLHRFTANSPKTQFLAPGPFLNFKKLEPGGRPSDSAEPTAIIQMKQFLEEINTILKESLQFLYEIKRCLKEFNKKTRTSIISLRKSWFGYVRN